jgi:cyanate permease
MAAAERTSWPGVLAAYCGGLAAATCTGKLAPALPAIQAEFGLSLVAAGWLSSMFNVLGASGGALLGLAADRIGALRFVFLALGALIAGSVLGALAGSAALLFASRVLEGLGFIAISAAAPGLIAAAATARERGLAVGIWSSYMPAGAGAIIALCALVLTTWGWRGVWLLTALVALASLSFLWSRSNDYASLRVTPKRSLATMAASMKQPVPWLLGASFGVYNVQFYAVMVWLPTYLLQTRGIAAAPAALLTALYVFVNFFGNLIGTWLVHRNVGRGWIIGGSFVVTSALFVGIFAQSVPDPLRYLFVLGYSIACGPIAAAVLTGGTRYARSPAEAGSIQGLIVQLTNVGIFLGPPIVAMAVTAAAGDWSAARWVLLGAGALGLAIAVVIGRFERGSAPR